MNWSYEATLKAAFLNGKRDINGKIKVFLTRIGGGAFANDAAWIDEAVISAVTGKKSNGTEDKTLENSGLVVTLNNFFKLNDDEEVKKLVDVVQKTNGKYTRYKNDGAYNLTLDGNNTMDIKNRNIVETKFA